MQEYAGQPRQDIEAQEAELRKLFKSEQEELNHLKAVIPKLQTQHEQLGQIDAVQLTNDDIDRLVELEILLPAFIQRKDELDYKLNNIQDLSDEAIG